MTTDNQQKVLPESPSTGVGFGFSVSISGDTFISGMTGDNDNGNNAGAAYVFVYDSGNWIVEQKLLASDGSGRIPFGNNFWDFYSNNLILMV